MNYVEDYARQWAIFKCPIFMIITSLQKINHVYMFACLCDGV